MFKQILICVYVLCKVTFTYILVSGGTYARARVHTAFTSVSLYLAANRGWTKLSGCYWQYVVIIIRFLLPIVVFVSCLNNEWKWWFTNVEHECRKAYCLCILLVNICLSFVHIRIFSVHICIFPVQVCLCRLRIYTCCLSIYICCLCIWICCLHICIFPFVLFVYLFSLHICIFAYFTA